jgi:S1-C subfamily serine protease
VPAFAARDKGNCIHCHNVRPALYEDALAAGTWKASDGWFQPPPAQIGVDVAEAEQNVLTVVVPGSPADTAGLEVGERLLSLGGERILTAADLAWVLGTLSPDGGDVPFEVAGSGAPRSGVLVLAPGWKKPSPLAFSWRPFRWALSPAPGFGGTALKDDAKAALGVAPGDLAFVVKRFFLGPDKARFAREAQRAGILQGDIIVAANGKRDFTTPEHFQTWWSLEHRAGDEIEVELLRDGRREVVRVRVVE